VTPPLPDVTIDAVVRDLSDHIRKLEVRRLQLLLARKEPNTRASLVDVVGPRDASAVALVLVELERAKVFEIALEQSVSFTSLFVIAQALEAVPTNVLEAERSAICRLLEIEDTNELLASVRRWKRSVSATPEQL
jgi:hypothetical protein